MALQETSRQLRVGTVLEVYWRVQREGDDAVRRAKHEWKWFPARITELSYTSGTDQDLLRAVILHESSAEFEEASSSITVLSDSEFKEDDSSEIFSYRLPEDSSGTKDDDSCPPTPATSDKDEDYHPSKRPRSSNKHLEITQSWTLAKWRRALGRPGLVAAERITDAIISKLEDLEHMVMTHEMILHGGMTPRVVISRGVEANPVMQPDIAALQFLAVKMLDIIERTPPPASKISQSSKNAHKALPQQHWFQSEAECTLEDFDKIRTFVSRERNADVTFKPPYLPFTADILPNYTIIFHDFATFMWVLGAHSTQYIRDILVKVRYDRVSRQHPCDGSEGRQNKYPVSIDVFGCLLHDPANEKHPTYLTIGEAGQKCAAQQIAVIGRPDSSWSHVEAAYVHQLQVLQVEYVSLQQTYTQWRQHTRERIPFSLTWTGLEHQLRKETCPFSNLPRKLVLGKMVAQIPFISIRDRPECNQFIEAYNVLKEQNL